MVTIHFLEYVLLLSFSDLVDDVIELGCLMYHHFVDDLGQTVMVSESDQSPSCTELKFKVTTVCTVNHPCFSVIFG